MLKGSDTFSRTIPFFNSILPEIGLCKYLMDWEMNNKNRGWDTYKGV